MVTIVKGYYHFLQGAFHRAWTYNEARKADCYADGDLSSVEKISIKELLSYKYWI